MSNYHAHLRQSVDVRPQHLTAEMFEPEPDFTDADSKLWAAVRWLGIAALIAVVALVVSGCARSCQVEPQEPPYQPPAGTGGQPGTAGQGGEAGTQTPATGGSVPDVTDCNWIPARTSRGRMALEQRVVNGSQVQDVSRYPFLCALETQTGWQYCAATLRSADRAVTAAHCQVKPGDRLHCGTLDLRKGGEFGYIKEARHHPSWTGTTSGHDVAVLVLERPMSRATVRSAAADYSRPAWVVGWGSTYYGGSTVPILREAKIPLVPWAQCRWQYPQLDGTMLCAGNAIDGDACQGDSGGPLLQTTADGWVQVGVTSWGDGCAGLKPGVWTDLSEVEDWVAACSR